MDTLTRNVFSHPRRMGFIAFNLIALACLVTWVMLTQGSEELGVFGLPYYALGYVGMAFLAIAWIASWIAWIWMVAARHRRKA